ncbi:hypothetical protein JYP49_02710 [Nitratireductor aquimarinus]|uniref:RraA family protein n=1 Tax=Nitratireductor TaxID=245876 RepID=UPI0019D355DD|nr:MULTISPECIES: hypothetical protein [Nitratireductor]MBN7776624.1 hypothetical protein [Nitratireductor pacificus]MBN7779491.1 hypothetical protein [Nitratireductor pacificus]MBN7788298.1 hypothetical protein [Nitratireductor aquimarinus]MBY6098345.1 hypothetical protein [Nitratireductor aquimarinus]MCA1261029.1 hypothetical protein [Nitratireductor aquimarinus]
MALQIREPEFQLLGETELKAWKGIPAAVASDVMNRTQVMHASMKPIQRGMTIVGQARTVTAMVGDCSAVCELIASALPGEIIVVDAGGFEDTAVWGGMMAEEAHFRKLGGAVVWGAIRDLEDVCRLGFSMFCNAVVPRGPHQGFGGIIGSTVAVAGVSVSPGDVILGDADGVTVVPLAEAAEVLARAQAHVAKERAWIERIRAGYPIHEVYSAEA